MATGLVTTGLIEMTQALAGNGFRTLAASSQHPVQTSNKYRDMQGSLTSTISGHADSDKDMKRFSSLRYDGTLHGHYLRASFVSRRIEVHIEKSIVTC